MKGRRTSAHLLLTNRLFPDQSRLVAALSHPATFFGKSPIECFTKCRRNDPLEALRELDA
jgi:hypothetical protein